MREARSYSYSDDAKQTRIGEVKRDKGMSANTSYSGTTPASRIGRCRAMRRTQTWQAEINIGKLVLQE